MQNFITFLSRFHYFFFLFFFSYWFSSFWFLLSRGWDLSIHNSGLVYIHIYYIVQSWYRRCGRDTCWQRWRNVCVLTTFNRLKLKLTDKRHGHTLWECNSLDLGVLEWNLSESILLLFFFLNRDLLSKGDNQVADQHHVGRKSSSTARDQSVVGDAQQAKESEERQSDHGNSEEDQLLDDLPWDVDGHCGIWLFMWAVEGGGWWQWSGSGNEVAQ